MCPTDFLPTKVLFVDDEPNIRLTLPAILNQQGFEVQVAATVAEALDEINSQKFDVLISDLNMGHPADGFLVVSSMRRVQPKCVNLILTGYPGFESALQALQAQVDDYLVKPADIQTLVKTINQRLENRKSPPQLATKRVATLLRENVEEIKQRVLDVMKSDAERKSLGITDDEKVNHLPVVVKELAELLEAPNPEPLAASITRSAARHATRRQQQGYSVLMLDEDARLLQKAIFETLQNHIIESELSFVLTDLSLVVETLQWQVLESIRAFLTAERGVA